MKGAFGQFISAFIFLMWPRYDQFQISFFFFFFNFGGLSPTINKVLFGQKKPYFELHRPHKTSLSLIEEAVSFH